MQAFMVFLLLVLAWVLTSGRLSARSVTGPIALTAAGFALAGLSDVRVLLGTETVRELIEMTLAVVLFTDASKVGLRWFATEWRYPARLLGIGFPLTVVLGGLAAWWSSPVSGSRSPSWSRPCSPRRMPRSARRSSRTCASRARSARSSTSRAA